MGIQLADQTQPKSRRGSLLAAAEALAQNLYEDPKSPVSSLKGGSSLKVDITEYKEKKSIAWGDEEQDNNKKKVETPKGVAGPAVVRLGAGGGRQAKDVASSSSNDPKNKGSNILGFLKKKVEAMKSEANANSGAYGGRKRNVSFGGGGGGNAVASAAATANADAEEGGYSNPFATASIKKRITKNRVVKKDDLSKMSTRFSQAASFIHEIIENNIREEAEKGEKMFLNQALNSVRHLIVSKKSKQEEIDDEEEDYQQIQRSLQKSGNITKHLSKDRCICW
jgi:hypothetical protein